MPSKTSTATWRSKRDPLWRGDHQSLAAPKPKADPSIVRHILYLDGVDRETPYHSTTENRGTASVFAGSQGRVWETSVPAAQAEKVRHISRLELLRLLKGKGQGAAEWASAHETMTAKRYVEQWGEHLLNYADLPDSTAAASTAAKIFK